MNAAKTLIQSLARVDEWRMSNYTITHLPSGLKLWTANGWMFLKTEMDSKIPMPIPLWKRPFVWPHVRRLQNALIAKAMK